MEQGHFAAMNTLYDAIVVGAGPAGLTAAMYLARSNRRILVLEKGPVGGQITLTHEVENFPTLEKLSGQELAEKMQRQAEAFGAEILTAEVTGFDLEGAIKILRTSRGDFFCRGVVLATGAKPKPVGFSGEETFKGRGVSWCAVCDGRLFTGRDVFVVGGGYSAAEESLFLAEFARHVTVLIRKSDFACPKSVSAPVKNHKKITVLTNTVLEEVSGEDYVNFLRYKNTATGEVTVHSCQEPIGVFVFAGLIEQADKKSTRI